MAEMTMSQVRMLRQMKQGDHAKSVRAMVLQEQITHLAMIRSCNLHGEITETALIKMAILFRSVMLGGAPTLPETEVVQ